MELKQIESGSLTQHNCEIVRIKGDIYDSLATNLQCTLIWCENRVIQQLVFTTTSFIVVSFIRHIIFTMHIFESPATEKLRIWLEYSVDRLIRKLCNNRGIMIIVNIDSFESLVARNKVRKIDNKRTEHNECQLILLSVVGSNDK